jgi:TetR/AcrR family transcriptional repressor of lmrAB and yxaGH operons
MPPELAAPNAPAPTKRGATRRSMLISAAELLQQCGAAGVTIDAVLARSGAPRGSVYHHFPGGRNQLLTEALRFAGDAIAIKIDNAVTDGGHSLLRKFVQFWDHLLSASEFTAGCPVAAAAVGSFEDDPQLTEVAGEIFARWRTALSRAFVGDGFDGADADSLATMCIASLEGAVILCRSARSAAPLHDVAGHLEFLVKAKEFVLRNGLPARK